MPRPRLSGEQTAKWGFIPPPMGGLDTISPAAEMDPQAAVYLQNLIPAELGTRVRLGSSEWCTNLDGGNPVLSVLPFNAAVPANDKLFATTKNGIWDVTASSQAPTKVLSFAANSANAGLGSCHVMVTSAGHFLAYCDEVNGYHLYSEQFATWVKVVSATQSAWVATTAYTLGQYVANGGNIYLCSQAGTSAGSGGPTGTNPSAAVTDGTAKWLYVYSVSGVDPANFVHVLAFKGRLWFTQVGTANAWFLGLVSIQGAASQFSFGGQFRAGGPLRGLWNWTVDGGQGMDDYLVGLSGGGDVVVYQGTDPTQATTFGIKGVWGVGSLPFGRKVATSFGGDILIASMVGLVPLSKLVIGNVTFDRSQYATYKIQNLFNKYMGLYGGNAGWDLVLDPLDNALLVLVPIVSGAPNTQLAMSLANRNWFPYSGLPMNCAAPWNGTLYFGTADGRVIQHTGYVDGVTLANPGMSNPIQWAQVSSFQSLGSPSQKKVELIRAKVEAQSGAPPLVSAARYDFDQSAPAPVSGTVAASGNAWDTAIWNTAVWGGDYSTSQVTQGATGMGVHVAVAVAGLANSRTVYAGADVLYQTGGFL